MCSGPGLTLCPTGGTGERARLAEAPGGEGQRAARASLDARGRFAPALRGRESRDPRGGCGRQVRAARRGRAGRSPGGQQGRAARPDPGSEHVAVRPERVARGSASRTPAAVGLLPQVAARVVLVVVLGLRVPEQHGWSSEPARERRGSQRGHRPPDLAPPPEVALSGPAAGGSYSPAGGRGLGRTRPGRRLVGGASAGWWGGSRTAGAPGRPVRARPSRVRQRLPSEPLPPALSASGLGDPHTGLPPHAPSSEQRWVGAAKD